tara:strand:+ start:383 stop:1366 length:984 start_codon:yes stop_codon:yes gene_type:complete
MNYLFLILLVIIIYFIVNNGKLNRDFLDEKIKYNVIKKELDRHIPENSFVKPEHKLLNLLNNISSSDKIILMDIVDKESYTSGTISQETNDNITDILKKIISSINNISETDFYIKNIENVYFIKDKFNNLRFIVDTFIYDVKNYYTIRLSVDIVIYNDVTYINYLDIDESAVNNILNKYDIKYHAQGILSKYNMFVEDSESILNKHYKENYKVIGIKDNTSLEYDKYDTTGVFTLDQLILNYLPAGTPNAYAPSFCDKDNVKFDKYGVNKMNEINSDCVAKTNNLVKEPNIPYDAPGVITQRVDFNEYDWLKNPQNGNIIYSHGFNL